MLTIVVYHYVRDAAVAFPQLKTLGVDRFEAQLDYLTRHYTVVSAREVVAASTGDAALPPNACWLTFDDGLKDHIEVVLPRLVDRRLPASFFPTVAAARQDRVLSVHKIQFIRAAADPARLIAAMLDAVAPYRGELGLPDDERLYAIYSRQWDRWDAPEQIFVKSFLQKGLPEPVRSTVVDRLFARFVTDDERAFAQELYAAHDELRLLLGAGMNIGGHGYSHVWLGPLDRNAQAQEIDRTHAFLQALGDSLDGRSWVMSYPHGSYNAETLELLRSAGCALGLGLQPDLVESFAAPLELPRLDTNDLPVGRDAEPNEWTRRVAAARGGA